MSKSTLLRSKRLALTISASIAALAFAAPVYAADLPVKATIVDHGEFRAFISGGVFWTGGDEVPYNEGLGAYLAALGGAFGGGVLSGGASSVATPDLGWDGAVGADYRFAGTPWHVNMQFRYGQVDEIDTDAFGGTAFSLVTPGPVVNASAPTQPTLEEHHWQADLGVGYDILRGAQLNFGFRVAELKSEIEATTNLTINGVAPPFNVSVPLTQTDRRSFFGAGPRLGLEGSIPFWGAWTFDYSGNAALLFGNTKYSTGQVLGFNLGAGPVAVALSGVPLNQLSWSAPTTVYNFDVEGGVGWWVSPGMKFALSYRVDAFVNALRIAPDDGVTNPAIGPGRSMDRFYHGPKATLTARF